MLNHEERLKTFLDSINRETQEKYNKILGEIENQSKNELEKTKQSAEKKAQDFYNKSVSRCKTESNNKIAGEMMKARTELSKFREKITADVFHQAREKLNVFSKSDDYKKFISESAAALFVLLGEDARIFVKDADLKLKKEIEKAFNGHCTVCADIEIEIGGLKGKNSSDTLLADDTLDTRLKQQYEWFLSNCNLNVDFK